MGAGVQLEADGGGATVITLNTTREPEGMAAAGDRDEGWIGTHFRALSSQHSESQGVGARALTLTLPVSLRWGYGCGNRIHKPTRLDQVRGHVPGPRHVWGLGATPPSPKGPEPPSHGPPLRSGPLEALGQTPRPFPTGAYFPKGLLSVLEALQERVQRSAMGASACPKPVCTSCVSSVKQGSRMHLKQAGRGGQSVCPEGNPSVLRSRPFSQPPQPRITELECVSLRGRCYGDFINNIIFRIPVPSTRRKGRQAGNAERGGENNDLAPPPPAREEGAHLPFPLIGRKLRSPERSCRLPRPRPRRLAKPGREKQTRAPTCFDRGLKGTSGGLCRGGTGARAAAARMGPWEQRWGQELPPSAQGCLCTRLARTLHACHLTVSPPSTPAARACPSTGPT